MESFLFMLLGGIGLALSFYFPHQGRWTSDHSLGAGMVGFLFGLGCFGLAMRSMIHH
jgi:hypothetical protein